MWIYSNNLDQVIWLAEKCKWAWHLNLFSRARLKKSSVFFITHVTYLEVSAIFFILYLWWAMPLRHFFCSMIISSNFLLYSSWSTCIKEPHIRYTIACPKSNYRIHPNNRTYPYKRTVKQFRSFQITARVLFDYFCIEIYVVGTHLNCIDLSMQFKWVPTIYDFIKKIRKKKLHKHHQNNHHLLILLKVHP